MILHSKEHSIAAIGVDTAFTWPDASFGGHPFFDVGLSSVDTAENALEAFSEMRVPNSSCSRDQGNVRFRQLQHPNGSPVSEAGMRR